LGDLPNDTALPRLKANSEKFFPGAGGVMKMRKDKSAKEHSEALKLLDYGAVLDKLWQTAQAAGPLDIGPRSARSLRAWNAMGVMRMEMEGRLSPEDLAIAETNLKRFIQLMKTEAVFLGRLDRLDNDCFHAAHRRLERRSILSPFTLWPFWPNDVFANN
jgi:glycine cleavage system aminomethyltransferase T